MVNLNSHKALQQCVTGLGVDANDHGTLGSNGKR